MAAPDFFRQGKKTAEAKARMEEVESELADSYSRWEELEAKKGQGNRRRIRAFSRPALWGGYPRSSSPFSKGGLGDYAEPALSEVEGVRGGS